jgi:hypothetical protein
MRQVLVLFACVNTESFMLTQVLHPDSIHANRRGMAA